jgi:hypothetical protein
MLPDQNDEMVLETGSMVAPMPSSLSTTGILDLLRRVFSVRCCGQGRSFANWRRKQSNGKRGREFMRRSNFALHIPPTLFAGARKAAESEGVALNQLITVANENAFWPGTNRFPDKHPHAVFDR